MGIVVVGLAFILQSDFLSQKWILTMKIFFTLILFFACGTIFLLAQDTYDSGGPLIPEQAAYDVTFYDLQLEIDPEQKSISGSNAIRFRSDESLEKFVLDFDALFVIDSVLVKGSLSAPMLTSFERVGSRIWVDLQKTMNKGDSATVIVHSHGQPREAPNPPWNGGFTWGKTPTGEPWISVSCQNNGADIWWPCKDHPSDEPDSMSLKFTVPTSLTCISNGQLRETIANDDGTHTFSWFVSTPVNNYGISLYIGPYETSEISFTSTTGEPFDMAFIHLEGMEADYQYLIPQIPQQVAFLEEILGPYPFRIDKYTAVQAPYLGMEHQTCIAYGANSGYHYGGYNQNFDGLHLHELAHEWWGNMITASDWKDFWLHEGFATYMEALFAEHLNNKAGYQDVMQNIKSMSNRVPIAPQESRSTGQIYGIDIYHKGAWVLHTLRYVLGDKMFFESLQRFLYPDPSQKETKDGRQCRLVSTTDFINTVENISGRDMEWFFDIYVRRAGLPLLQNYIKDKTLYLEWKIEDNINFPVDVPVQIDDNLTMVKMMDGKGSILLDPFVAPQIDPDDRILKGLVRVSGVVDNTILPDGFLLEQNYPNPFNAQTKISFVLPEKTSTRLTLHNVQGETIDVLLDDTMESGRHQVEWDASQLPSGIYTYRLQAGDFVDMKKMTLIK
jgi:aminopeptidase N